MWWRRVLEKRGINSARAYSDSAMRILAEDHMLTTVSRFKAMPLIRLQTQEARKRAAVLIPLCLVNGKLSLLYTLRTSHLRSHKGQVSFPGGMQDELDRSLEITALRETHEELGIPDEKIRIWGRGNFITGRGDTTVLPIIGTITDEINPAELNINPAEVEKAFAVSLEDLCKPTHLAYTQFRGGFTTPIFLGGEHRIWGLTAVITNAFLRCLLPPNMYSHKVRFIPATKASGITSSRVHKIR